MTQHITIVHDDKSLRQNIAEMLREAGYAVTEYPDALTAINALGSDYATDLLITRVRFAKDRSNGAALAMLAKRNKPDIHIIFIAFQEMHEYVKGLGVFLPAPVAPSDLLAAVWTEIGPASDADAPPNEARAGGGRGTA